MLARSLSFAQRIGADLLHPFIHSAPLSKILITTTTTTNRHHHEPTPSPTRITRPAPDRQRRHRRRRQQQSSSRGKRRRRLARSSAGIPPECQKRKRSATRGTNKKAVAPLGIASTASGGERNGKQRWRRWLVTTRVRQQGRPLGGIGENGNDKKTSDSTRTKK